MVATIHNSSLSLIVIYWHVYVFTHRTKSVYSECTRLRISLVLYWIFYEQISDLREFFFIVFEFRIVFNVMWLRDVYRLWACTQTKIFALTSISLLCEICKISRKYHIHCSNILFLCIARYWLSTFFFFLSTKKRTKSHIWYRAFISNSFFLLR